MTPVATSHILATNYGQSQEQDIGAPHRNTEPPTPFSNRRFSSAA